MSSVLFSNKHLIENNETNKPVSINSIPALFQLVQYIADNAIREMGGREIWIEHEGQISSDISQKRHLFQKTHCCTTGKVLLGVFFGPAFANNIFRVLFNYKKLFPANDYFKFLESTTSIISGNRNALLNETKSGFCVYTIALLKNNQKLSFEPDRQFASTHVFLIVQYGDSRGVHYRVMQSFLEIYDLKTELEKKESHYTHDEITEFLLKFNKFLTEKNWTKELSDIFQKYFHGSADLEDGKPNPYFEALPFYYARKGNLEEVEEYFVAFEKLKETTIFQNAIKNIIL